MKNDRQYYKALAQSPVLLKRLMLRVAEDAFLGKSRTQAVDNFTGALSRTMALADVLGRKRIVDATKKRAKQRFRAIDRDYDMMVDARFGGYDALENPTEGEFDEAFEALMSREPIIAKSKEEISAAYGLGQKFALTGLPRRLSLKAAQEVTVKLWEKVAELGMEGRSPVQAKRVLAEIGNFAESYAETIYRTNLAGAYTAGRFKQMQDPDVRAVAPAFEYMAIGDHSTRKNHAAADGLLGDVTDSVWDRISPPMGYNCRCDLRIVDRFELEDRGLLLKSGHSRLYTPPTFKEAHPDKGFTVSRPDRRIYAAS